MESKEALENIMKFMQDLEDNPNPILSIPAFTMYLKELKTIHKDLEILEILSRHLIILDNKAICYISDEYKEDNIVIRKWAMDSIQRSLKNRDKMLEKEEQFWKKVFDNG